MSNRTNEYGSRVPENFGGNGYPGVADLLGIDKNQNVEFYDSFWYYPEKNDANLSINAGIGKDAFLSYSDQALWTDDKIDNYFEVLDFNPADDLLILPFLTTDDVKITQENNFIIAEIDSGTKDKIFKIGQQAVEKNIGFADQFDSKNIQLRGVFKFNTPIDTSKSLNNKPDAPVNNNKNFNKKPTTSNANRTNEYGSRVPENFGGNGYPGVADLLGIDKNQNVEFYDSFWYYPEKNDANLSINAGIGKDAFLSYSDQALWTDDKIDNYFEVLDFNPADDLLILPFLTTDDVKITQENNFIIAEIDSGTKDKIFKIGQQAVEKNIGFADQFDSKNIQLRGVFKFNTPIDTSKSLNNKPDAPVNNNKNFNKKPTTPNANSKDLNKWNIDQPYKYKRKFIDKITNFDTSSETLEIDTESFGIKSTPTFAASKNKRILKKRLAKLDIDFLYDKKKGGLYFNENGSEKGFGDGGIIAILKGTPDLTSDNLEFI